MEETEEAKAAVDCIDRTIDWIYLDWIAWVGVIVGGAAHGAKASPKLSSDLLGS